MTACGTCAISNLTSALGEEARRGGGHAQMQKSRQADSASRQKQAKPATMSLGGGVGCRTWRHTKAYTISHAFLDVLLNGEKKADHGKPCVFREVLSVCPTGGAEEGERFPQEQKEVAGMPRCTKVVFFFLSYSVIFLA